MTPLESLRNEHNKNYTTLPKKLWISHLVFLIKSSISLSRVVPCGFNDQKVLQSNSCIK